MEIKKLEAAIEAILFTMGESVELSQIADAIQPVSYTHLFTYLYDLCLCRTGKFHIRSRTFCSQRCSYGG